MDLDIESNRQQLLDEDQNSCGTSISNSLDTANESDMENDNPTLVPDDKPNEAIARSNEEIIASMFQPAHDVVKKEFPVDFGFGNISKRDNFIHNGAYPGTSARPPFLLPAQLYKNFFANFGKRKRNVPDSECPVAGFPVYPRNMLFSTGTRPSGSFFFGSSDDENCDRATESPIDEVQKVKSPNKLVYAFFNTNKL